MSNQTLPPARQHKKKSGSETRQRKHSLLIRLTEEERLEAEESASRAGLTLSSFGRVQILKGKPPRSVRRPPVEVEKIAQLLGALGKTGSNLNQIAHAMHLGDMSRARIEEALREAEALKQELRKFLGRRG